LCQVIIHRHARAKEHRRQDQKIDVEEGKHQ
jgi:hypothetical protein